MKTAGYIIGSIEIMIGTVLLSVASMTERVLPVAAALLIGFGLLQVLFFGLIQKNK